MSVQTLSADGGQLSLFWLIMVAIVIAIVWRGAWRRSRLDAEEQPTNVAEALRREVEALRRETRRGRTLQGLSMVGQGVGDLVRNIGCLIIIVLLLLIFAGIIVI